MLHRAAALVFAASLLAQQTPAPKPEPAPIVKKHSITLSGKTYNYTTTTGRLPISNEQGEVEAHMFFIAYTLDGAPQKRPLMFSFNGGPGSASVWLHLGVLGPKIVKMQDDGGYPPPPFQLIDNEHSFLPFTDMVFIDPVGTGASRPAKGEKGEQFWGVDEDVEAAPGR